MTLTLTLTPCAQYVDRSEQGADGEDAAEAACALQARLQGEICAWHTAPIAYRVRRLPPLQWLREWLESMPECVMSFLFRSRTVQCTLEPGHHSLAHLASWVLVPNRPSPSHPQIDGNTTSASEQVRERTGRSGRAFAVSMRLGWGVLSCRTRALPGTGTHRLLYPIAAELQAGFALSWPSRQGPGR